MLIATSMALLSIVRSGKNIWLSFKNLFQRLSDIKLMARPTKCVIGSNQIEVVGHCRVARGVKGLHEDNVKKI